MSGLWRAFRGRGSQWAFAVAVVAVWTMVEKRAERRFAEEDRDRWNEAVKAKEKRMKKEEEEEDGRE